MDISNPHNLLAARLPDSELKFGIRVGLPAADPLRDVLGADWYREHWFATAGERDAALGEMARRHPFSRIGDTPSIRLEAIRR
ncbi:MAG: hypothetical protein FJ170_04400 [Gammaproteobacteria bacterium]|nr:hypothetical protein [Gammaproteobacteria bacterium]